MPKKNSLYHVDPDWNFAAQHGRASRTGMQPVDSTNFADTKNKCRCCNQSLQKQSIKLGIPSSQLKFLGLGFPLFYQFLKYCIILLIIMTGCYNAVSLMRAIETNKYLCDKTTIKTESEEQIAFQCFSFAISIAKIATVQPLLELTMRIVAFVIHCLVLLFIRNKMLKMQAAFLQKQIDMNDYSILIKGISLKQDIRKNTALFFQKQFTYHFQKIQQIIILPYFSEIVEFKKKRQKQVNKLRKFYKNRKIQDGDPTEQQYQQIKKQIKNINTELAKSADQYYAKIQADKIFSEVVIVVFNTEADKLDALKQSKKISQKVRKSYFGSDYTIRIKSSPNPQQIIWNNFNLPHRTKLVNSILGWGLSAFVLGIVFTIFYFILSAKSSYLQHTVFELQKQPQNPQYQSNYAGAVALVFILMFFIVIFDKLILVTLFHKFTELQRHSTTANYQLSFAIKYALGLFFTTAIMTIAVEAIRFHNYYTHPFGVIDQQSIMFFVNSFFLPLFWITNPFHLYHLAKRWYFKGRRDLTQLEANKLMENDTYDLGKRFAEIIEMMWFVFFYATLIPVGAIIAIFGLTLYYWVDKYNLLRRSTVIGKVSGQFMQTSLSLLDLTLILKPAGAIIFDIHIRGNSYQVVDIVMICVAFVFIITPKNFLIKLLNSQLFKPKEKTYEEARKSIRYTFDYFHPLLFVLKNRKNLETQNAMAMIQSLNFLHNGNYNQDLETAERLQSPDKSASKQYL